MIVLSARIFINNIQNLKFVYVYSKKMSVRIHYKYNNDKTQQNILFISKIKSVKNLVNIPFISPPSPSPSPLSSSFILFIIFDP